jgi:hypothetical protein
VTVGRLPGIRFAVNRESSSDQNTDHIDPSSGEATALRAVRRDTRPVSAAGP